MRARIIEASADYEAEFLAAVKRSRLLHRPWVYPPRSKADFRHYLQARQNRDNASYFVLSGDGALSGVINVSEIVRGAFRNAYLGYYAFAPHAGQGYMALGLRAVITRTFAREGLHRLEANIQPRNLGSIALVKRLGFRLEGFSPRYLKIAGRWRDHERWAITREDWRARVQPSAKAPWVEPARSTTGPSSR